MSPSELQMLRPVSGGRALSPFGAFIDRLIQTFEDRRAGLTDAQLREGEEACAPFFAQVYEQERERLRELVREQEHLSPEGTAALFLEVDRLVRTVVLPAYLRLTVRFTPRERNDFFLSRDGLHTLERVGWGVAGVALGAFFVWARFLPLWSREAVIPAMVVGGLLFPNLRRYLSFRRYERELNKLVLQANREVGRIDVAYLLGEHREGLQPVVSAPETAAESDPTKSKGRVH